LRVPIIRNLDAAEAAYQRSLAGWADIDYLNRGRVLAQVGVVYHERFKEARWRGKSTETTLKYAKAARGYYQQALDLCPPTALTDLGSMHGQLGNLYEDANQTECAREHYETAAWYFEQTGDRYKAGQTRHNMGVMYLNAAERETVVPRQRDLLHRAQAYAQAALRDFQHYQGRVAKDEAKAQQLLADIAQALAKLPG